MPSRYFFDVPVYRLTEERYYRERDKYIKSTLHPKRSLNMQSGKNRDEAYSSTNIPLQDYLQHKYGGCWKFNEIIGYIRLYFLGSQVRGEYFAVRKQRIVRTRTKVLENLGWKLAPEIEIPYPRTSQGIYSAVLEYIANCRNRLPRRHIDTELFEVMGQYVDWLSLIEPQ